MCDMADAAGTQTRTTAHGLIDDLREARQVELAVFTDLADDQMLDPQERFLEPPIWEVGRVGWFPEYWILRKLYGEQPIPRRRRGGSSARPGGPAACRWHGASPRPRLVWCSLVHSRP